MSRDPTNPSRLGFGQKNADAGFMTTTKQSEKNEFLSCIEKGVALVDFNASWCAPCRDQEPIIRQMSEKFEGRAVVSTFNIDEHRAAAIELGIHSIPTMILYKDGREIKRLIGLQAEEVLTRAIEKALK